MKAVIVAIALLVFVQQPVFAIDTAPAFADPAKQERYDRLIRELRCVQCRGQSIADSNVGLAADLRRQVRELMAANKTDEEILTYMTDRYGDYILYTPPIKPTTWLLWAAPVLLMLSGGIAAAVVIRRKSHLPTDDEPESARDRDETTLGAS
ncbi:MAG TPA: cytochrome c-type biogenesis protein [Povalibacter sp.]|nr:cytochrome c-type biogenesis protein [Povalibacter sp.]